jgi:glycosyltransferase involved in cell wall biosynthesis
MNILFITTKCPLPTNDGHSLRSFNLLKQVAAEHKVHLLSFVKYQHEYNSIEELEKICHSVQLFDVPENKSKIVLLKTLIFSLLKRKPFVVCKYDTQPMRQAIQRNLTQNSIDIVHFDMLPLAVYLDEVNGPKTVLDEHNVESMLLKQRVNTETRQLRRWFFLKQQKLLEQFERFACREVDYIVTCSQEDKNTLNNFAPCTPVEVVPNGVDSVFFAPDIAIHEEPYSMIFVGGLNWFPNLDALQWFDKMILSDVLKEYPQAHLHIIGQQSEVTTWYNKDAITCHGLVEDIRPYMAKATVFVVPLRIGGGTRLKILNAMSMGKAVVSTTIGAEGLGVFSGDNIVLADKEKDFSKVVKNLFVQSEYRAKISRNGREYIAAHYQWDIIGKKLLNIYEVLRGND